MRACVQSFSVKSNLLSLQPRCRRCEPPWRILVALCHRVPQSSKCLDERVNVFKRVVNVTSNPKRAHAVPMLCCCRDTVPRLELRRHFLWVSERNLDARNV